MDKVEDIHCGASSGRGDSNGDGYGGPTTFYGGSRGIASCQGSKYFCGGRSVDLHYATGAGHSNCHGDG
mgnify:CR=1 FL=1